MTGTGGAGGASAIDLDALITPHMSAAVAALDGPAELLFGIGRYHLGWVDQAFEAVPDNTFARGKRIRPAIALLCCAAAGGDPATAAPLAAAIELLHNFTLIHDDIQDRSPARRHRATVWSIWGEAQAINAGDALFAAAHLALYRLRTTGVDSDSILCLAEELEQMTLAIVSGQVLDLSFETRNDVTPDQYLEMIAGKTSAIVRYAAWGGAMLGGAGDAAAGRFGEFGLALGLGFQVQDDLLGVWGSSDVTGKAAADDIRRKKQSLPIVLLHTKADADARAELESLYQAPEIDAAGIERVLALLDRFDVRPEVERLVTNYHDEARRALASVVSNAVESAASSLSALVEALSTRTH